MNRGKQRRQRQRTGQRQKGRIRYMKPAETGTKIPFHEPEYDDIISADRDETGTRERGGRRAQTRRRADTQTRSPQHGRNWPIGWGPGLERTRKADRADDVTVTGNLIPHSAILNQDQTSCQGPGTRRQKVKRKVGCIDYRDATHTDALDGVSCVVLSNAMINRRWSSLIAVFPVVFFTTWWLQ